MGHFEGLWNLTSRLRPQGCWVNFDGPRKLSFHLRPRGGVKLMCEENWALIWDLEEGPIWGKLSFETLMRVQFEGLRKSTSLFETWMPQCRHWALSLRRFERVEGNRALIWDLEEGSNRGAKEIDLSFWNLDALAPWGSLVFAEIWGGGGNWALIRDFEVGSTRGAKKVDLSFWNLDALAPWPNVIFAEIWGVKKIELSFETSMMARFEGRTI
jgi:hypothetical protein